MTAEAERNVVLIGMPWSGKSTVGVLLAKALARAFVDTDVVIQAAEGRRLQEIIDRDGVEAMRAIEERHLCALECRGNVIATGGSVVYSERAMRHLKSGGCCVYLQAPFGVIQQRAVQADSRGLVRGPGQTLRDLYDERLPLYEWYADVTVACGGLDHERTVAAIIECLPR